MNADNIFKFEIKIDKLIVETVRNILCVVDNFMIKFISSVC